MKETWGFAWLAVGLCVIAIVSMLLASPEVALPTFFSFLPVVFFLIARIIKRLNERIADLESALKNTDTAS